MPQAMATGQSGTMMGWLDGLKTTVAPDAKGQGDLRLPTP